MKNANILIEELIDISLDSYQNDIKPDRFAATVAHVIAKAIATQHCPECADAAVFIAVLEDISSKMGLAHYSADLAKAARAMHTAQKNYQHKAKAYAGKSVSDVKEKSFSFEEVMEQLDDIEFVENAREVFTDTYTSTTAAQALVAACAAYPHAFAYARATYVQAIALAARYNNDDEQEDVFVATMTKKFQAEINRTPIDPSLFMQFICNYVVKIIGMILLAAGLLSLSVGICGLAIAAVNTYLLAIGLTSVSLTVSGVIMTALGSAHFAARFFTQKKWDEDNDASQKAVDAINAPAVVV